MAPVRDGIGYDDWGRAVRPSMYSSGGDVIQPRTRVFMRMGSWSAVVATAIVVVVSAQAPARKDATAVYQRLWSTTATDDAGALARDLAAAGVSVDEAYAHLARGRAYSADVPRGVVREIRRDGDIEFPYTIDVPSSYDASRPHQVRVQLHGGVMRPEGTPRGDGSIGALRGADHQIYVMPNAWREAPWWTERQAANVAAILDAVKRRYNVDENRVVLSGVSDGATAAFYMAMRDTTPYASFLPLNGFILVLRNRDIGIREPLYPHNLSNKPFFVVNGGQDPLYPTSRVTPYVEHFKAAGLDVTYRPQADGGHNTAWWPTVKDEFEAFVAAHPRRPHPAQLTWETDSSGLRNRAHWLVIDKLDPAGARVGDAPPADLPDLNDFASGTMLNFGIRTSGSRVTAVTPGSNAEKIGLRPEDVFVSINGQAVPRGLDPLELLGIYESGSALTIVVAREHDPVELSGIYEPVPTKRVRPIFQYDTSGGRVDLVRDGNTITAHTRGVQSFRLLLSPAVIDFSAPVKVVANGRTVFDGRVRKDLETLIRWAVRDNDRTMLYAAELPISLPR